MTNGSNATPAFVRQECTERFLQALPIIQEIIVKGLALSPEAAELLDTRGKSPVENMQVPTISERIRAIEVLGKFGPGIRVHGSGEDQVPEASVIEVAVWDTGEEYEDITDQKELPSGNGQGNGTRD